MRPIAATAILLAVLAACGGGGGTTAPAATALRFQLDGTTIGATAADGTVALRLADLPAGLQPVLLEADLAMDAARLTVPTARTALAALQSRPTLDGGVRNGLFHVVYGDDRHPAALRLAVGGLFRVVVEPVAPRSTGDLVVELRNLRVVDQDGATVRVAEAPITAHVTIQ